MTEPAKNLQPQMNLGTMIDQMNELREQLRALTEEEKELKQQFEELERAVMCELDNSGTTMSAGSTATVSISEEEVGNVKDWDAFYEFIKTEDAFFLLQRRIANAAYRELKQTGQEVPGVTTFTRRKLNLRKKSST